MIRSIQPHDAASIVRIYNHYILNSTVTFEEQVCSEDEMNIRIVESQNSLPWIVYLEHEQIVGYAYASKWKGRCAYRYSAESSVYLHPDFTGRGLGTILYTRLLDELKTMEYHAVIAGISLPNPSSIGLHELFGFEKVAHFKEVGRKFDQWIDVGYWQLLL